MARLPRSVIREHHFEKDLAKILGDIAAADDFGIGTIEAILGPVSP